MKNVFVVAVDPGLTGGVASLKHSAVMPTYTKIIKPAVEVFRRDEKGNKMFYKSGPMKGLAKYKIKAPAKTKKFIDVVMLADWFAGMDIIILEDTGTTVGNSARTTKTTQVNWGKLYACAELSGAEIIVVTAGKWKGDLGLPADKLPTIEFVEKETGRSFRTEKGALRDGEADATAIAIWYRDYYLDQTKKV